MSVNSKTSTDEILSLARLDLAAYALANYPAFQLPPFLELVVSKLEAVERGEVKRLMLSLPPRHGKSLVASTYFPAWYLGRHPDRYVIGASYGQDLADDFGRRVRNTVASPLHRAVFPESRIADDSAAVHRFNLTAGGAYFGVGRGAAITGRGAHLLLIDDPLKDMAEALSDTIRHGLHQWFSTVAYTRLMPDAAIVLIQTRWHEDDLAGWLLREFASEGWESLSLPAIAEANDPVGRAEGEALWSERYSLETLESIRHQLGSAAFASLFQQRPAAVEGRVFKREWWRSYPAPPTSFIRIIASWDTAFKKGAESDFSACTVWGETSTGFYLLYAWRGKVEFPELCRKVKEFSAQWNPSVILVEDKASGQSLVQSLRTDTNLPIVPVKVDSDKLTRAQAVTGIVEAGKVLLPERAGWLDDYLDEISTFPAGLHDDWVDATTQALNYMRTPMEHYGVFEWYRLNAERIRAGVPYTPAGQRRGTPPQIIRLIPSNGSCSGGETISLSGANFENATSVTVGGAPAVVSMNTSNTLVITSPPGAPGPADVVVSTPGGSATAIQAFTYVANG